MCFAWNQNLTDHVAVQSGVKNETKTNVNIMLKLSLKEGIILLSEFVLNDFLCPNINKVIKKYIA